MSGVEDGEKPPKITHEERLSRVFDEVMGLGDFADSSRSSFISSPSGGQDETKGVDKTSGAGENQPVEEEDSNSSRPEEKMDEGMGELSFPRISSPSSVQNSSFTVGTNEGGGGGSGGAAFDDALDGLPSYGPEEEEEEEDWHFALQMGTLEDVNVGKTNPERGQPGVGNNVTQDKPFARQPREEQEREGSSASANTSHSSQDHTPDNSRDGGVLNQTDETEDSQQGERSDAAPMADSNPPISPSINIKDEPIDEGYDAALLPQSSIRQIKEELEHQEEELRISSVYSVGGGNTFASPTVPAAVPAPTPTAIFIPGRGQHVLQAIAPLPLRPPAPIPSSLPALVPAPPRPPPPSVPGSVRCSGCSKVLLKGQTAFQRKGSTQLFCSTVCLTGHLPPANKNRSCFQCSREIVQPRDMITIPSDGNTYFYFCGQFCLSVFRHKKKTVDKVPDKWPDKRVEKKPEKPPEKPAERPPEKPFCSVCRVSNRQIEHEVTHQGRLHRLCSNACFVTWRKMRQLAMNCCEGCGLYCSSSSGSCQTLTIERTQLNFCGPTCIGTYKQTCRKTVTCAYCHKMAVVSSTLIERDQRGKVQLYCSSACVEQSRPPPHILTGAAFPCCQCRVSAVPQYHLAMVDGTIRNFCSYDCVSIYRKSGDTSQPDLTNGTSVLRDSSLRDATKASSVPPIPQDYPSSVPYPGHHPSHTSVPPLVPHYPTMSSPSVPGQAQARAPADNPLKPAEGGPSDPSKLNCHQCSKQFNTKPLLFSNQGRISMFCSRTCSDQYKTQKNILMVCEFCKQEKVPFDIISYNQQDLIFCSENCKLLFKHDITSRNKDHPWRPCTYCSGIGQKMLHSHYGGKMEEFCKPHCMSQYTVLYYGMGRCDSCRKQSYMTEKLQCLGSVRNFCNLPCLLQYCHLHFETSQHTSSNGTGAAPQAPYGALPTSNVDGKNLDHASTQTDAMGVPVSRRRQMKNKSVLCRPFTMDQESMCQLPAPSTELAAPSLFSVSSPAGEVKVLMVPVPVPVFIPVPMNMYTQHTPVPMAMPVPIPVPMVVPPQKKDMKDAAVQSEPLAVEECRPVYSAEQSRSYSRDMKSEVVTPITREDQETQKAVQANLPRTVSSERSPESTVPQLDTQLERSPKSTVPQLDTQPERSPKSTVPQLDTQPERSPKSTVPQLDTKPERGTESTVPQLDTKPERGTESTVPQLISQPERATESTDPKLHTQPEKSPELPDTQLNTQPEGTTKTSDTPTTSAEHQPPSSPMMDLETDIPSESLDQTSAAPQRGVKRPREGFSGRKRGRRRTVSSNRSAVVTPAPSTLNHLYGVKAWKSWVQQRNKHQKESNPVAIKEDILQCDSAELSYALSCFIIEVRRPNGEAYSPDSIFYLCLGIQQYLFMEGRIENIFNDPLYSQFAAKISGMLHLWKPKLLPNGGTVSPRILESYLWECKQLGAYSPIVLLNTLLFFCTKNFRFTTLAQHQSLSFTNFTRHSKPCSRAGKVHYLRYQRSSNATPHTERYKKKQGEDEGDLEMFENIANPLHCPVRLYEFYLSRCPESVKSRSDLFFLQPEQFVHPQSSHWYTFQPLDGATLQSMLTRILAVREVHQEQEAAQHQSPATADNDSLQ
ncbi:zinc finger MYM-type protein 4-like isoform X5 [Etheostoma cragini]|uniref:zinc finger MYM-type protein 4-like isoform X5 n=1 Tax=Etheostoma cragini TaxID=417921 RepID=UPI00155F04BD|nr:zinc finger MYM-type protein 4-like isoform X5 [Etheostoma cragini]